MELIVDPQNPAPAGAAPGGGGGVIKDSDTQHFMQDVIEASMQVPVIVDFWATWCGPCKQLTPMLEKLVRQAGGLVRLVKIDVDQNQDIAAQLRVQSVPTVYAFRNGQPVDAFMGAQPESQIKRFIERLTGGQQMPVDALLEQARQVLDQGDAQGASAIYQEVLAADPENGGAMGGLIRCLMAVGETERAREFIDGLTDEMRQHAEVKAAEAALELAGQDAASDEEMDALRARIAADPKDHQARLDLAQALYSAGRAEEALDELLDSLARNRAWNEEAARKQMLKIFEALGPTDERVVSARRRLSSILFS